MSVSSMLRFLSCEVKTPIGREDWKGTKSQRSNFRSMGLHYRALQNAGLIERLQKAIRLSVLQFRNYGKTIGIAKTPSRATRFLEVWASITAHCRTLELLSLTWRATAKVKALFIYSKFRESLENRHFALDKDAQDISAYKKPKEALLMDVFRKTCGIITTLSKTADNKLKAANKPIFIVIDEAFQNIELENSVVINHPFSNSITSHIGMFSCLPLL